MGFLCGLLYSLHLHGEIRRYLLFISLVDATRYMIHPASCSDYQIYLSSQQNILKELITVTVISSSSSLLLSPLSLYSSSSSSSSLSLSISGDSNLYLRARFTQIQNQPCKRYVYQCVWHTLTGFSLYIAHNLIVRSYRLSGSDRCEHLL